MSVADVWCKSTELIAAFWLCASLFIVLKWSFETLKSWSACLHSNFLNTLLLKVFYTSCLNTLNSCGYAFPLCVCVCVTCVIVCVHVFVCICFQETNLQSSNILPCRHCLQRQLPEAPCLFLLSLCFTVLIMGYCLCVDISRSVQNMMPAPWFSSIACPFTSQDY